MAINLEAMKGMKMPARRPKVEVEIGSEAEAPEGEEGMEGEGSGIDLTPVTDEELMAEVEKRGLLA